MYSSLLKTKSFWTGIAAIVTGIGMICVGDIATGLQTIATGITAIVLRDAIIDVQNTQRLKVR